MPGKFMIAWTRFAVIALLAVPLTVSAVGAGTAIVSANGEELHGRWVGGIKPVAEFAGIPFAQPPVGDLRWRAPVPHDAREGVQDATRFAAACMQSDRIVDWYAAVAAEFGHGREVVGRPLGMSEDCLYLNVWTPRPVREGGLPVMVFVHGGSNSSGWSYEPNYVGVNLAGQGVVVVTIAYRLGLFGFFSHPAFGTGETEDVANFGLLDIRAAFQWVHDHIEAFGGDPKNITAFGESAGAFNLVDLLLADLAAGKGGTSLFARLVSQSIGGPPADRQTLEEEQALGVQLAGQLGIGPEVTASQLRSVPAVDLLRAQTDLPKEHYFDAVIDGRSVVHHPLEPLGNGQAEGVELVIGNNEDEWYMYVAEDSTRQDLEEWIMANAPQHRDALLTAVGDEREVRKALDRLRTGRNMRCPSRYLAARLSDAGGKAWIYNFSRQRAGPGGERLGAYHGTELPYVFDSHDAWLPTDAVDRELTVAVMDYWVGFASKGDPNVAGRPRWPRYTRDNPVVLQLGDRVVESGPIDPELCDLLRPGAGQAGEGG